MKEKTTEVTVNGQRYQVRRMTPTTGSYIWQRLMASMFKAQMEAGVVAEETPDVKAAEAVEKATPEQRLRGMCGIAFMHLSFTDTEFMQTASMKVISRIENLAGNDMPMPIMDDSGRYAIDDVASDPFLVTRLTVEALVFSLAPFLAESGA